MPAAACLTYEKIAARMWNRRNSHPVSAYENYLERSECGTAGTHTQILRSINRRWRGKGMEPMEHIPSLDAVLLLSEVGK